MKARIKATGEIIDVEYEKHHPCADIISYKEKNGAIYYSEELDFDFSMIDWEKRRYEIAKDILASSHIAQQIGAYSYIEEEEVKDAVRMADLLIKELKKKNNYERSKHNNKRSEV